MFTEEQDPFAELRRKYAREAPGQSAAMDAADHGPDRANPSSPITPGDPVNTRTSAGKGGENVTASVVAIKPTRNRRRGFLVGLDGRAVCNKCGEPGQVPHHLSLIFWKFWTREQMSAVLRQMRPGERLAWLAHGLVRLQAVDGCERTLRERNGAWFTEPTPTSEDEESFKL